MKSLCFAIVIFVSFCACSPALRVPTDLTEQNKLHLAFRIDSVAFVDSRLDTVTAEMKLPLFASRQREWKISPALSPDLQEELKNIIQSSSNPEGIPTLLTVVIEEGYYKISGNAFQVGEYSLFNCTLLFDLKDYPNDFKTFARANYDFVGAFNATEKHVKQTYGITAHNGVYTALKNAEKVFDN
jgi:hypothetical protein